MTDGKLYATAEGVLLAAGVGPGQRGLDFGCRAGTYAIPMARLVGPAGWVTACDRDEDALGRLRERAARAGVGNLTTHAVSRAEDLPLETGTVNVVLLYDVLHDYYFSAAERAGLLKWVARLVRPGGVMSVFPNHMSPQTVDAEIVAGALHLGFRAATSYEGPLVHDEAVSEGHILNFRKCEA